MNSLLLWFVVAFAVGVPAGFAYGRRAWRTRDKQRGSTYFWAVLAAVSTVFLKELDNRIFVPFLGITLGFVGAMIVRVRFEMRKTSERDSETSVVDS